MKTKTEEAPSDEGASTTHVSGAVNAENEVSPVSHINDPIDEETLREICTINGVNYEKRHTEAIRLERLEMFFFGYERMIGLTYFPNLTELVIMYQNIAKIESLASCPFLQTLWVCECNLSTIEGLDSCKRLRELFLYSNHISRIANLDRLNKLERLWLNSNEIECIEGLEHLTQLEELNLSANRISRLGSALDPNQALQRLHLSGNFLASFKDLIHLTKLPQLRVLNLKDPQYGPNPACLLSNYAVYLLYHLPHLERLDTFDVAPPRQARDIAESITLKKKMFYFMKSRAIKRSAADMLTRLHTAREESLRVPHDRIRVLCAAAKELERELRATASFVISSATGAQGDRPAPPKPKLAPDDVAAGEAKLAAIRDRLSVWEKGCRTLEHMHSEACRHVRRERHLALQLQQMELESGGNIKFEEGGAQEPWVRLVGELLTSRFCVQEFRHLGIIGIRAHRVLRLHNRLLTSEYDRQLADQMETLLGATPSPGCSNEEAAAAARRQQEFLFWSWEDADYETALRTLEDGFDAVPSEEEEAAAEEEPAGVAFTNSVNIADRQRVRRMLRESEVEIEEECPFRVGRILICKTFIGRSMQLAPRGAINAISANNKQKLKQGRHLSVHRPQRVDSKLVGGSEAGVCDCHSRQLEWRLFAPRLALPEYLVEFEYVTRARPANPFHAVMYSDVGGILLGKHSALFNLQETEVDTLTLPPRLPVRPLVPGHQLSEQSLLALCPEVVSFSAITDLNLHESGLQRLKPIQECTSLRRLVISFNEVARLDEVSGLPLETLDVSFNRLQTLDGMRNLVKLKVLDLSWNRLHNSREDVSLLRKYAPNITHLQVHHNPWQKADALRLRLIGRMKALIKLDDQTVTETEAAAAMRMAAGSRVSQVMMLTYGRTDNARPRSFSLLPASQILCRISSNRLDRSLDDANWFLKISSLCVDGQHISKISNLDRLENLRYASFDDNDITRIEGLSACVLLEELSLEDNCITRLEGLDRLPRLKRLMLANNYLTCLTGGGLESLLSLQLLAVDNNKLTSLRGVERSTALLEVYAANNRIGDTRELFYLKGLPNLLILDLFGNALTAASPHYRASVVFHLKTLKALDGRPIDTAEANSAKELLGGKLTCDFLIERLGHDRFYEMRELDFPSANIRAVELRPPERFINLRSVNLERNNLAHFSGIIHLSNLKVLCLNYNHVESLFPKPSPPSKGTSAAAAAASGAASVSLDNLEVLHLACNGIKELTSLQLHRLPSLRALFLQGNDLTAVEGLDGLLQLRELVLDRNKIKALSDASFTGTPFLRELHLEENRLRGDLLALAPLGASLERLFLGSNRVQDLSEVERLELLPNLSEVSLVNNAVARRMLHRPLLIHRLTRLQSIDGVAISEEEREKTELYFSEQLQQPPQPSLQTPQAAQEVVLPGIGSYKAAPGLKVTNMNLNGSGSGGGGEMNGMAYGASEPSSGQRGRQHLRQARANGLHNQMYCYEASGHVEPLQGRWGAVPRHRK